MAYEQLTSPNGVERLASVVGPLVPFSQDHTLMLWYRHQGFVNPGDFPTVFYVGDDPQLLYAEYLWCGLQGSSTAAIGLDVAGLNVEWGGAYPEAKGLINNHICYVREGSAHRFYVNARLVAEGSKDVSAFTAPTHQYLGTDTYHADWAPHEGAYFREWNKALTIGQIEAEMDSHAPVELDHLFSDVPFQTDFDDSGIRGINVPTGSLTFTGHKLGGITVPARALALEGHAPDIDTFLSLPTGALGLAGAAPLAVIGP